MIFCHISKLIFAFRRKKKYSKSFKTAARRKVTNEKVFSIFLIYLCSGTAWSNNPGNESSWYTEFDIFAPRLQFDLIFGEKCAFNIRNRLFYLTHDITVGTNEKYRMKTIKYLENIYTVFYNINIYIFVMIRTWIILIMKVVHLLCSWLQPPKSLNKFP